MKRLKDSERSSVRASRGPLFSLMSDWQNLHCRSSEFLHLSAMQQDVNLPVPLRLRIPGEPEPSPIQEPPDPPENPDLPVREPDPEDPGQI